MKKLILILLCLFLILTATACDVKISGGSTQEESDKQNQEIGETVDVDLTVLSSTMVYSEVYNMVMEPDGYVGKTVKIKGSFAYATDESTGKRYYACIVRDATACCAQGIEFEPTDNYSFPGDFPESGGDVTVFGTFDYYDEGHYRYLTLRNARMIQ